MRVSCVIGHLNRPTFFWLACPFCIGCLALGHYLIGPFWHPMQLANEKKMPKHTKKKDIFGWERSWIFWLPIRPCYCYDFKWINLPHLGSSIFRAHRQYVQHNTTSMVESITICRSSSLPCLRCLTLTSYKPSQNCSTAGNKVVLHTK